MRRPGSPAREVADDSDQIHYEDGYQDGYEEGLSMTNAREEDK